MASELDALANAIPQINDKVAKQQQQAQRINALKGAAQAGQQGMSSNRVAQTIAPAATQSANQIQQQAMGRNQQQLGQVAQQAAQQQGFQGQQQLARQGMANQANLGQSARNQRGSLARQKRQATRSVTSKELKQQKDLSRLGIEQDNKLLQLTLQQREDLAQLGNGLEDQLIDSRRRFAADERGRKFNNLRQMADWTKMSAIGQNDFNNKMQIMDQSNKRSLMMQEGIQKELLRRAQMEGARDVSKFKGESTKELARLANDMKRTQSRYESQSKAVSNLFKAASTIASAVIKGG